MQDTEQDALRGGSVRRAVSSPDRARDQHRAEGLFGPPVGGFQSGTVEKRKHGIPFPQSVVRQAPVGRGARAPLQNAVQPRFQLSPRHGQPRGDALLLVAAVPQVERRLQQGLDRTGKLRPPRSQPAILSESVSCATDLDYLRSPTRQLHSCCSDKMCSYAKQRSAYQEQEERQTSAYFISRLHFSLPKKQRRIIKEF